MNKIPGLALLIGIAFFLTGCPYESDVSIDKPVLKYPVALLGKWEPKSSSDNLLILSRKDDFVFTILKTKKEAKADDTPETYEGFLSDVGGVKFLNLYEAGASAFGSKKYYLYKLELSTSGARITLTGLSENIDEKFTNSAELKAFIQKHLSLSFFYDKEDEVYIRAE